MLDELARATGESAHFSVPMGDAVVVLARTSGPGAFQLNDRVGVVRPAHCTALGKIMLAALPPDQFERYLQRAELKAHTPKIDHLGRAVWRARSPRCGAAGSPSMTANSTPSCAASALPVRDFSGRVIGAVGISGPVWRLSIEALQKRARAVRAAADRLSAEFGYRRRARPLRAAE